MPLAQLEPSGRGVEERRALPANTVAGQEFGCRSSGRREDPRDGKSTPNGAKPSVRVGEGRKGAFGMVSRTMGVIRPAGRTFREAADDSSGRRVHTVNSS